MDRVFLLWHVHPVEGEEDEKLIGVYKTHDAAQEAIARLGDKPGFRDCPEGFLVEAYEFGQDHWTEGYVTV